MVRLGGGARSAVSFMAFLLMVGGLVGLLSRGVVFSSSVIVIGLQLVAVLIMIWARATFGIRSYHATAAPTRGGLITTGPYGYIRHPIYSSICLFTWASSLGHLSAFSVGMALVVTIGAAVRIAMEEALLVDRYPDYAAYASRTKRLVPFVF